MLESGEVDPPKARSVFVVGVTTEAKSVLVSTVGGTALLLFHVGGRAPRVSDEVLTSPDKAVLVPVVIGAAPRVAAEVLTSPDKAMLLVSGVVGGTDTPIGEIVEKPEPVSTLGALLLRNVVQIPSAEAISRPLPFLEVVPKSGPLINLKLRRLSPVWAFSTQHWTLSPEEEEGQRFRSLYEIKSIVSLYGGEEAKFKCFGGDSSKTYRKLAT